MNTNIKDGVIDFYNLKLRPLTIGSMDLCNDLGLSMFKETNDEAEQLPVSSKQTIRETAAYLWIHSQDIETVLNAARQGLKPEQFHNQYIIDFMFQITPEQINKAVDLISESNKQISEAIIQIESKPNEQEKEPNCPKSVNQLGQVG